MSVLVLDLPFVARSAVASALVGLVLLSSCGDHVDAAGSGAASESDAGASDAGPGHLDDGSDKAPGEEAGADASRPQPTSPEFLACTADCRGCCTVSGECRYIDVDQKATECLDVGEVRGALCHSCAPEQMCSAYNHADDTQPNRPTARCWAPAPLGAPCTDNSDCKTYECDPSTHVCSQSCRKSQEICQGAPGAPVIACCDPREKCTFYAGPNQSLCCLPPGATAGATIQACDRCCQGLGCGPDPGETDFKCRPPTR